MIRVRIKYRNSKFDDNIKFCITKLKPLMRLKYGKKFNRKKCKGGFDLVAQKET